MAVSIPAFAVLAASITASLPLLLVTVTVDEVRVVSRSVDPEPPGGFAHAPSSRKNLVPSGVPVVLSFAMVTAELLILAVVTALLAIVAAVLPGPLAVTSPVSAVM